MNGSSLFNLSAINESVKTESPKLVATFNTNSNLSTMVTTLDHFNESAIALEKDMILAVSEAESTRAENDVMSQYFRDYSKEVTKLVQKIDQQRNKFAINIEVFLDANKDLDNELANMTEKEISYKKTIYKNLNNPDFPKISPKKIFKREYRILGKLLQDLNSSSVSDEARVTAIASVYDALINSMDEDWLERCIEMITDEDECGSDEFAETMYRKFCVGAKVIKINSAEVNQAKFTIVNAAVASRQIQDSFNTLVEELTAVASDIENMWFRNKDNVLDIKTDADGVLDAKYQLTDYSMNRVNRIIKAKIDQLNEVANLYIIALSIKMDCLLKSLKQAREIINIAITGVEEVHDQDDEHTVDTEGEEADSDEEDIEDGDLSDDGDELEDEDLDDYEDNEVKDKDSDNHEDSFSEEDEEPVAEAKSSGMNLHDYYIASIRLKNDKYADKIAISDDYAVMVILNGIKAGKDQGLINAINKISDYDFLAKDIIKAKKTISTLSSILTSKNKTLTIFGISESSKRKYINWLDSSVNKAFENKKLSINQSRGMYGAEDYDRESIDNSVSICIEESTFTDMETDFEKSCYLFEASLSRVSLLNEQIDMYQSIQAAILEDGEQNNNSQQQNNQNQQQTSTNPVNKTNQKVNDAKKKMNNMIATLVNKLKELVKKFVDVFVNRNQSKINKIKENQLTIRKNGAKGGGTAIIYNIDAIKAMDINIDYPSNKDVLDTQENFVKKAFNIEMKDGKSFTEALTEKVIGDGKAQPVTIQHIETGMKYILDEFKGIVDSVQKAQNYITTKSKNAKLEADRYMNESSVATLESTTFEYFTEFEAPENKSNTVAQAKEVHNDVTKKLMLMYKTDALLLSTKMSLAQKAFNEYYAICSFFINNTVAENPQANKEGSTN